MPTPALLVFVRHAESARNVAKKGSVFFADDESRSAVRGIADYKVPLTDTGRRQAEATGRALRERFGRFDAVVHSGYRRTVETTLGILAAYDEGERAAMPMRHDVFVRERDAGHAFDMTTAQAAAAFPWLDDYWQSTGPFFARPPGGESVADVCERVERFLTALGDTHAGQRVLVVTHGVTLRAFRYLLEGWDYDTVALHLREHTPRNASVTVYEAEAGEGRLRLREFDTVYWE
jgi:broad specificity phosphatase PhoE